MRLTTKGRYAVTAMVDLAMYGGQSPVSLADIAKRQEISLSYLEQLFAKLRKNGLVVSVRGPGGGYKLSRSESTVFISQIIDAVNETVDATNCNGKANCHEGSTCITHHLWSDLSQQIHNFLDSISLQKLIDRSKNAQRKNTDTTQMNQDLISSTEQHAIQQP